MIALDRRAGLAVAAVALALAGGGVGYVLGMEGGEAPPGTAVDGREVLYWYDPMVPSQHFDKPGKSPFMEMQLVPRFADEADAGGGVAIDPSRTQNLGLRTEVAQVGKLDASVIASGTIAFNERDVSIVQARAAGFVQRVYGHAPSDVIEAGAPLADILVPEWAGAQTEFLAVRKTGDEPLIRAARQRLALLGMPQGVVASVERAGRVQNVVTVSTPAGGTIKSLGVRSGMTVGQGQTLAEINGLGTVWLDAAVPESAAGLVRVGQGATASLTAFPGESFAGRVTAILPSVQEASRTLTVRIELPNRGGRLRPGMFATVGFTGDGRSALLVPTEAVIRTGRRALVMLALNGGRYQPAEVQLGREAGGQTEIIAGLAAGERVITSGQFLIDSEASLSGVQARPIDAAAGAKR
ncbi:efflux RND transporter periplasmic adaptor subunit [Altererythrobacter sp. Root672]|uniref:efflux RND transporter periplasmic adaptor subunit n=1 Tax=Altererythrobacter sp. Root672 TaxID=1736584 RepID=UPI0006FD8350|nr:efflux RND transporter periplasmic adaptor subunit [Altererythrobacter sp. Root672]KRA81235.1 RND transporter [Altererythrobacter sp. Root672]